MISIWQHVYCTYIGCEDSMLLIHHHHYHHCHCHRLILLRVLVRVCVLFFFRARIKANGNKYKFHFEMVLDVCSSTPSHSYALRVYFWGCNVLLFSPFLLTLRPMFVVVAAAFQMWHVIPYYRWSHCQNFDFVILFFALLCLFVCLCCLLVLTSILLIHFR